MKISKTITMSPEEVNAFVTKCLKKYIESKMECKVTKIDLDDGATIQLEEEEVNDE